MTEKQTTALEAMDAATEKFASGDDMYGAGLYNAARAAVKAFPSQAPEMHRLLKAIERFEDTVDNGEGLFNAVRKFVFANVR